MNWDHQIDLIPYLVTFFSLRGLAEKHLGSLVGSLEVSKNSRMDGSLGEI